MATINKNRYWTAVLYPENMIETWKEDIDDILQLPYCYCIHDIDKDTKSDHRKTHVHIILVFNNTTTYKHAFSVFDLLSKSGATALSACQAVLSIRSIYDYLIHDTDGCRKKDKELYDPALRICGNNFDIGAYEQLSQQEKNEMILTLCKLILKENFVNFTDFFEFVLFNYEIAYIEMIKSHSGFFERLTKGNFLKMTAK